MANIVKDYKFTAYIDTPMVVRFEFNGELSLQQKLQGSHEFELSGLVPEGDGKLVLFVDDEETMVWNVTEEGFELITEFEPIKIDDE